jgi:hypothetical protein
MQQGMVPYQCGFGQACWHMKNIEEERRNN